MLETESSVELKKYIIIPLFLSNTLSASLFTTSIFIPFPTSSSFLIVCISFCFPFSAFRFSSSYFLPLHHFHTVQYLPENNTKTPKMQLTLKECGLLAFIFFTSPAVGSMVNGAPVPLDARNEINRLQNYEQPDPVIQQRAPAKSSSSGGGLLGIVGKLAPLAEDVLPMLAFRDVEAPEPSKGAAVKAPAAHQTPAPKGPVLNAHDEKEASQLVAAHNAAEAHVKSVNELKSKILNDPTARQKLYNIITSASAAHAAPTAHAAGASDASHVVAQRAPAQSSKSGGGLLSLVGDLAPFAEDLLPLLARDLDAREPEPATAQQGGAAHQQAVEALQSKLASDPTARAKAEKLAKALATKSASKPTATIAQRAAKTSSSGGGLLGLVGDLAPFAEDLLPLLARGLDAPEPAKAAPTAAPPAAQGAAAHQQAVNALHSKLASDPAARAKAEKLAKVLATKSASKPTATIAQRAAQTSSGGDGLMSLVGDLAPFAEDILPMLF